MKIALLSDLHIPARNPKARTDDAVAAAFAKLEWIYSYLDENDVRFVLQAGDFFNAPRSWSLIPEMIEFFYRWNYKRIFTYAVFGQHDTYLYSSQSRRSTNLGILETGGFLRILEGKTCLNKAFKKKTDEMVYVHGVSWGDPITPPVRLTKNEVHILVAHAPVCDRELYPGHEYTSAKKLLKQMDFDLILVGDAHIAFDYEYRYKRIVNTGPLMRLAANKDMLEHYPHFYVYDTATKEIEKVPVEVAEDADKILSREHIDTGKKLAQVTSDFVDSLQKVGSSVSNSIRTRLENWLSINEVDPDVQKTIFMVIEEEGEDD